MIRLAAPITVVFLFAGFLAPGCAMTDHMSPPRQADLERRAAAEIVELHEFFRSWYRGEAPDTDQAFARFEGALAHGFVIVAPSGQALERSAILEAVRGGHGSEPGARIWIENVQVRQTGADFILATYEEWQAFDAPARGRISTVLFDLDADGPNGLRWRHVHETWMPGQDE